MSLPVSESRGPPRVLSLAAPRARTRSTWPWWRQRGTGSHLAGWQSRIRQDSAILNWSAMGIGVRDRGPCGAVPVRHGPRNKVCGSRGQPRCATTLAELTVAAGLPCWCRSYGGRRPPAEETLTCSVRLGRRRLWSRRISAAPRSPHGNRPAARQSRAARGDRGRRAEAGEA